MAISRSSRLRSVASLAIIPRHHASWRWNWRVEPLGPARPGPDTSKRKLPLGNSLVAWDPRGERSMADVGVLASQTVLDTAPRTSLAGRGRPRAVRAAVPRRALHGLLSRCARLGQRAPSLRRDAGASRGAAVREAAGHRAPHRIDHRLLGRELVRLRGAAAPRVRISARSRGAWEGLRDRGGPGA